MSTLMGFTSFYIYGGKRSVLHIEPNLNLVFVGFMYLIVNKLYKAVLLT